MLRAPPRGTSAARRRTGSVVCDFVEDTRAEDGLRVGYLGPEGTYTEEAAAGMEAKATRVALPTIEAVFEAVAIEAVERGVVPFENLLHGPVTETLDSLYRFGDRVRIVDMVMLPIEHALGALEPFETIERILSKDQALKQCSLYLDRTYPEATRNETTSTSAAMKQIVEHGWRNAAAIGSVQALERYGLSVVARGIGNTPHNKTRFAVLAPATGARREPTQSDATAIAIYPHRNRIGLLEDILAVVSHEYRLNLSAIHSRPDSLGAFRFFIEVEGALEDETVAACVNALRASLAEEDVEVRAFGSYPRRAFIEPKIRTIGIIGGTGAMGSWFRRFFENAGYEVRVSGRTSEVSYQQCISESDVVIVNVPIRNTVEVIQSIGAYLRPGQLLTDNTSIKIQPVEAMLNAAPEGVEVLGMHTVFGPAVDRVDRQNVIFTRTERSRELCDEFENVFYKYGARVTRTTPEHHDRQMAFHQNLEHFTKVVLASVLRGLFTEPSDLDRYSSPNSRASLATMGRILCASPELSAEIQEFNREGAGVIARFVKEAAEVERDLAAGRFERYAERIRTLKKELGASYVESLREQSLTSSKNPRS